MPVEVRVPSLGESIVEATVGRWLKGEGDQVKNGEPLVELETDKVNVEVTSEQDGVLQRISYREGDTVNVGDIIGLIGEAAAGAEPRLNTETAAGPERANAIAASDQKETLVKNEAIIGSASRNGDASAIDSDLHITPMARRLAEDHNLDITKLKGTGPNGRITKEDVAGYIEGQSVKPSVQSEPAPQVNNVPPVKAPVPAKPAQEQAAPVAAAKPAGDRPEERIRMTRRRQTIATRLVEAQHTAAMLTTFNEIDMTAVMDVRKRRKDSFKERHGVGLGFMSFFTKAAIGALKAFPYLNAEIQSDEIVLKRYYDIGIAVGTEEGLVVPVVRDADKLTFADIEKQIGSLAVRAREGKLTLNELQGGTFTITNGGTYGSLMSTPILNTPQVGILGMHKIEERPVAVDGQVVIRPMMYVALSYDHRIVDGSDAVRFLVRIKELVEDPESLLLEG